MGNCQGFCVTNANISSENELAQKRQGVTVDRVQMALQEKDAMFGQGGSSGTTFYEDGAESRNKGTMQMRKLGSTAMGASGYNNVADG
jgi:hypothetical protein